MGFRRAPGTSSLIPPQGTGPRHPEQAQWAKEGVARESGSMSVWVQGVGLGDLTCTGCLRLRTVSSHSRALGPSQPRTCHPEG